MVFMLSLIFSLALFLVVYEGDGFRIGVVLLAKHSKGFPPSQTYLPWGPTYVSSLYILGGGIVLPKFSKGLPLYRS